MDTTDSKEDFEREIGIENTMEVHNIGDSTDKMDIIPNSHKATCLQRNAVRITRKTLQDLLDDIALMHSPIKPSVGPDATTEEIEEDRRTRLSHARTKHRLIFSRWHRPGIGQPSPPVQKSMDYPRERAISRHYAPGKRVPKYYQPWGSTLLDFYHVHANEYYGTDETMTGSTLAGWTKKHGTEQDKALVKEELEWAEKEPEQQFVRPFDIRRLVRDVEKAMEKKVDGEPPFACYAPFSKDRPRPPTLQHRLAYQRLPKKLYVHDPYQLLSASGNKQYRYESQLRRDADALPWPGESPPSDTPDIVHVYNLKLSCHGESRISSEVSQLKKAKKKVQRLIEELILNPHTKNVDPLEKYRCGLLATPDTVDGKPLVFSLDDDKAATTPWIYALHQPPPWLEMGSEEDEKTHTPEAHLYISPSSRLGLGHHSVVYKAEWDLPRDVLFDGTLNLNLDEQKVYKGDEVAESECDEIVICKVCVQEKMAEIVRNEDGEKGERMNPQWKEMSGLLETKVTPKQEEVLMTLNSRTLDEDDGKDEVRAPSAQETESKSVGETKKERPTEVEGNSEPTKDSKKGDMSVENGGNSKVKHEGSEKEREDTTLDGQEECEVKAETDQKEVEPKKKRNLDDGVRYVVQEAIDGRVEAKYHGPLRIVHTGVQWQNIRYPQCEHIKELARSRGYPVDGLRAASATHPTPPATIETPDNPPTPESDKNITDSLSTVRLTVTAKLSHPYDTHLQNEARNYQRFPSHFFEHSTGYTIVRGIEEPVPLGAIVPQFYGYYVPEGGSRGKGKIIRMGKEKEVTSGKKAEEILKDGEKEGGKVVQPGGNDDGNGQNSEDAEGGDKPGSEAGREIGELKKERSEVPKGSEMATSDATEMPKEETKDEDNESDQEEQDEYCELGYRSPIMLIEDCGKQVQADQLSEDDQRECASLFYRMHDYGWEQGSAYERNVVVQPGPIDEWPSQRMARVLEEPNPPKSFRVIDFGRSEESSDLSWERRRVMSLFDL